MGKHHYSRARWIVLAALSAFAAIAPSSASADTSLPVWTCRASAVYGELDLLLGDQRIEPVLANGFPSRSDPDSDSCATADTGVQDTSLLPADNPASALVTLQAASASTQITPQIAPARDQNVLAESGIAETATINLGGLVIDAEAITSTATGDCSGTTAVFTGSSKIARLTINGTNIIDIPAGSSTPFDQVFDINLLGLVRVRLNQQIVTGNSASTVQELIQRAAHIELLPTLEGATQPLARVVLGETKADRNGFVCAAAPPPPTCPGSSIPIPGSSPLVCQLTVTNTVTAPCPANTTANAQGACVLTTPRPCGTGTQIAPNGDCIATPVTCPTGTGRDPNSNACILLVQRPCPTGATPDPTTQVCVLRATNQGASDRENGRIGSLDGPIATCGRIAMRFVKGKRSLGSSLRNRFGTRAVTRGRLVTCGSNPRPIIGARVDVVHVLPGDKRRRKTGLRSRANGLVTLILPIDLRSRRIEYAYRPDLKSSRVTSRVSLNLTVVNKGGRVLR